MATEMLVRVPAGIQPQAPDFLDSSAVIGLLVLIASLIFVVIGIGIMWNARGRNPSFRQAGASAGVALIGGVMIVAAVGGVIFGVAQGALDFVITS